LVGALIEEPKDMNEKNNDILGDVFIKPKTTHTYEFIGDYTATGWYYDKKLPLKVYEDGKKITIRWTSSYSG
jgi:hypothetical protein